MSWNIIFCVRVLLCKDDKHAPFASLPIVRTNSVAFSWKEMLGEILLGGGRGGGIEDI